MHRLVMLAALHAAEQLGQSVVAEVQMPPETTK